MNGEYLVVFELLLVFGLLIGLWVWDRRVLKRDIRKRKEAAERQPPTA
jgi:membrane protein required for beta-lactamase induction